MNCDECIWHSADGCTEWECNPITRAEAKRLLKKIVKCGECKFWKTGIAYDAVGVCKHDDHPWNQITNRNYYCADAEEKDG